MSDTATMTAIATNPTPAFDEPFAAATNGADIPASKVPTIKARTSTTSTTKRPSARSAYSVFTAPALVLLPLNDTFAQKTIELFDKQRVKIGRQTNAKTVPAPANGYFDSKVLSRTHAEVWSEKGKVYIKDVKSSNGTFLNGQRLSAECEESLPFELNQDDLLEFGIDIMNEDGSVLYHKVACKIGIVPASLDSFTNGTIPGTTGTYRPFPQPTSSGSSKTTTSGDSAVPSPSTSALSRTNKNATVEELIEKLQAELQKSAELGSEIVTVRAVVGEMGQVLSEENLERSSAKVTSLLRQLHDTRAQLAQYINKQRATEQLLASSQQEVKAVRALSAVQLQDLERRHREERDADRREFEAEVELRVRQRWEREGGGRRSRRARNPEEDFEVVQGPPGSPPRRRRRKSRIMPGTIQVEEEEVVEKNVKGIGAGLGVEIKGEEDGGVIESLTSNLIAAFWIGILLIIVYLYVLFRRAIAAVGLGFV